MLENSSQVIEKGKEIRSCLPRVRRVVNALPPTPTTTELIFVHVGDQAMRKDPEVQAV